VKGTCPGCKKEILWGDVIRGVFGRAGQMEGNSTEDDVHESQSEDDDDDDYDDIPITPRKKRVSGLVRLTGKPKTPTPGKPRATKGTKGKSVKEAVAVDATDDESTPKPAVKRKPRGKSKRKANMVDRTSEIGAQGVPRWTEDVDGGTLMMVPDSAGEANDVWVISSDDD